MFVQNFKILSAVVPEKSVRNNFIGEKEKRTKNGKDKREDAGSILHYTSSGTQCLYQISKSLVQ